MPKNASIIRVPVVSRAVAMDCFYIASQYVGDAYALPQILMRDVDNLSHPLFVAQTDGYVHGFLRGRLCDDGTALRIHDLYVDLAARRHGLGRRLVNKACDYARAQGARTMRVQSRPVAIKFYEKQGFYKIAANNMMEKTL